MAADSSFSQPSMITSNGTSGLLLHSAVLALTNLGSLWLGFIAFWYWPDANQLRVQIPLAWLISVVVYFAWVRLVMPRQTVRWRLEGRGGGAWLYGLAPLWAGVIFVPFHYVASGYLTAFSNIAALWTFQLVVNPMVLWLALRTGAKQDRPSRLTGERT